ADRRHRLHQAEPHRYRSVVAGKSQAVHSQRSRGSEEREPATAATAQRFRAVATGGGGLRASSPFCHGGVRGGDRRGGGRRGSAPGVAPVPAATSLGQREGGQWTVVSAGSLVRSASPLGKPGRRPGDRFESRRLA